MPSFHYDVVYEKENLFPPVRDITDVAENVLKKRYYAEGESSWNDVVERVVNHVCSDFDDETKLLIYDMILNRYFIPNSPCLVNAGKKNGGLSACFVVDFTDSIEGIYKTKLDFALVAKKGGGCGTTLSKIRPRGERVEGSAHGYAGGPVKFFDTICHDMKAMTQAGFREMAMMGTMSVYHPDILEFITAKEQEGVMHTTNISVVVDDDFMKKVINDEEYETYFDFVDNSGNVERRFYKKMNAKDVFDLIVEGAWRNGEPGLLFYNRINDSPYKYSNQVIDATNPCGEQPLPPNGVCNLGSLDISKFLNDDKSLDLKKLEVATKLAIRFLDAVIDKNVFPTKDIEKWAKENRPVGLGIMGLADYYLLREVAYGSPQALEELDFVMSFIYSIAENESIELGEEFGIPEACKNLPIPRRNVTLISIAPTGTISLLAGCSSGIEPIFSEVTIRTDKTGVYELRHDLAEKPYFRCAVSANGAVETTWKEHIDTQAVAQKHTDSGVSKTINFPEKTRKETIAKAFIYAWESGCKGITVYRNQSRKVEVLTPKNINKDKCPVCGKNLIYESGCSKCEDELNCGFSMCEVG